MDLTKVKTCCLQSLKFKLGGNSVVLPPSSNESNPSLLEDDPNSSGGRRSPSIRPRSRSLSSPVRSPVVGGESNEIVLIATLYKVN